MWTANVAGETFRKLIVFFLSYFYSYMISRIDFTIFKTYIKFEIPLLSTKAKKIFLRSIPQ